MAVSKVPREARSALPPVDRAAVEEQVNLVSRSFAFVIHQLREPLRSEVQIAYLLFRLGDNIEDTSSLTPDDKEALLQAMLDCFERGLPYQHHFAPDIVAGWRDLTEGEKALFHHTDVVIAAFRQLDGGAQRALIREAGNMFRGMLRFQRQREGAGYVALHSLEELDEYCYYVAGTVGDYLTERFIARMPGISAARRATLERTGRAVALVLQVTNILRDIRDDHEHQHIFYPRSLFYRFDAPGLLARTNQSEVLRAGARMIRWLMPSIRDAGTYIATLPVGQYPTRVFCTIPYVMALKTILEVLGNPAIFGEESVKITRGETKRAVILSQTLAPFTPALGVWFRMHWSRIERRIDELT